MSTMSVTPETRVLLHGIRWETYERLLDDLGDSQVRLTYADGDLEVMTPSFAHERYAALLGRAVEAMTEKLDIPILSGRSTTFRSRKRKVGLEPDQCYWIQNLARMRGKRAIDLAVDPAPDLVLEAEVARSALKRLRLFAELGVGEVWRYDGERLVVHVHGPSGSFAESAASSCFPWLPVAEFAAWIAAGVAADDDTAWIRAFRGWVRGSLRTGSP
jgi:Uma2 family endonuclease